MEQLTEKQKRAKWRIDYVQTIRGRALKLINNARARSVSKNIEIDLPLEWLEEKLIKNECEITKLPFDLSKPDGHARRFNAPSLDRIDKTKGYTPENTRLVLWLVNCALSEYGSEIVLPVLKLMVKEMENVTEKSTTPVSEGSDREGEVYPEPGSFSATWTGEDGNDINDYLGATQGHNAYRSAKEGSGDGVGTRDQEMESSIVAKSIEDTWPREPKVIWVAKRSRHLPD